MKWFNIKALLSFLFLASLVIWLGLSRYFERHSPITPDVEVGKVYSYSVGGKTVYLDWTENVLLYTLPLCAFTLFLIVARMHLKETDLKFKGLDT